MIYKVIIVLFAKNCKYFIDVWHTFYIIGYTDDRLQNYILKVRVEKSAVIWYNGFGKYGFYGEMI